ncbi:4Fe-4S binding protein [Sulfuritortus calidifontis]|uniref:4Fe-4S binding protein n=1 Tax=Sulfuritortus calidifontis TaxID=1914471 RepID=A0A4R3JZZ7_9PROT|nr:4Fe-4S binding protein [Sulfuritortus calidifontis]TCS73248.1 4Fe-4S binding protein [Sulfuritortus calidifontis]
MAEPSPRFTLGRLRLLVQLAMLFVTVYGGSLVGYYAAEKLSNALPALSCAYDKQDGAYCVLIPTQHQLHHRIGEAIAQAGHFALSMALPLAFTFLSFYLFFIFLNKAFCGWVCPLGTVQELLYRFGRLLKRPFRGLSEQAALRLRPVKWAMLLVLVMALPLLAGLGVTPHVTGDAFCQVCPSRIATTLLTADASQLAIDERGWLEFGFGALANTLFGFVVIAALAVRQPFCRICPLLALNAAFQRLSPMRLVKRQHAKCDKCGICRQACPMDIPEIHRAHGAKAFSEDCTLCGRCAEFCPDDDVIQIKLGPLALFRSRRDYYKTRLKRESPQGELKVVRWFAKPAGDRRA